MVFKPKPLKVTAVKCIYKIENNISPHMQKQIFRF